MNLEIEELVEHLNTLSRLSFEVDETPWRALAFGKAATTLENWKHPLKFKGWNLQSNIPGIGKVIKEVIEQFMIVGSSKKFEKLTSDLASKSHIS